MSSRRLGVLCGVALLLATAVGCGQYSGQPERLTVESDSSRLVPAYVPDGLQLNRIGMAEGLGSNLRTTVYAEPGAGLNPTATAVKPSSR